MRFSKKAGFYIFLACLFVILLSLFWIVSIYAQDGDPGPPELFMGPIVQIYWHGQLNDSGEKIWTDLTATHISYITTPPTRHRWVEFGNGAHYWQGSMGDGRFARFALNITFLEDDSIDWYWRGPVPDDPNEARCGATHYEMRWRVMSYPETEDISYSMWSEPGKVYFVIWSASGKPVNNTGG